MGVKGLWQLLLPIGRRISIETLEGQVLAVDASIWLTQFLKAMRDPETGAAQPAAHLRGFFRRICRLLFHRIRPVFVFDGAMPEAKAAELAMRRRRREKFAIASQETLQRLAKKLLHENLKRQRTMITSKEKSEAFESGFNPGDEFPAAGHNVEDVPPSDNGLTADATDRNPHFLPSSTSIAVGSPDLAGSEMGDQDSSEMEQNRPINDWDEPQATDAKLEHLGLFDSDDEDSRSLAVMEDNDNFDMSFLATLPPNRRKDAIEKVQRQQRMRSRKEHMPAAGDPLLFSQVQLSNFLKSSQLNRNIQTSLAAAVKHDNNGGDVMASDTTTRLELIREEITGHENIGSANKRAFRKINMEDKELGRTSKHPSSKQTAAVNDNAADDDDGDDVDIHTESKRVRQNRTRILRIEETDEESYDSVNVNGADSITEFEKADKKVTGMDQAAVTLNSDSSDDDEGGFIRQVPPDNDLKSDVCILRSVESNIGRDHDLAQQFQDRLLAEAIQNEEHMREAESSENQSTVMTSASRAHNPAVTIDITTERDDESVDWEDGDCDIDERLTPYHDGGTIDQMGATLKDTASKEDISSYSSKIMHESDWGVHTRKKGNIEDSDKNIRDSQSSANTSAALERAEKEASKLADWAGRVFRRAMKDAMKSETISSEGEEDLPSPSVNPTVLPATLEANVDSDEFPSLASYSNKHKLYAPAKHSVESVAQAAARKRPRIHEESPNLGDLEHAMRIVEQNDQSWKEERNRRERDMDSVSDEMKLEVMQLLQLFGIPYVEAPAEAESQCAELERLGLVNGIVTEDSDVFVFGGKTVYKNIFQDQKYAEVYKAADAEREMGLGRNEMVALAMLLGGDYTDGVKGVGIVNAMEIIDAFSFSDGTKEGLCSFRKWLDGVEIPGKEGTFGSSELTPSVKAFHSKHQSARSRWVAPADFPGDNILKAYLQPVVDNSTDSFTWANPDLAGLVVFCRRHIGWQTEETKSQLNFLVDGSRSGLMQTRLEAYMPMKYEDSIKFANVRSKRLQRVLKKKRNESVS